MFNAYIFKQAACGLCVGVGCFSDPPEIPGMASFLKHMIFMGSEKYSQEDNFEEFIDQHGGTVKASTDYEYTTFHFDIQEEHLLSALDRFAQFFIKPLIKKNSIIQELENIKNEFQLVPCEEDKRQQLFSSFAQTDPANKFTWDHLITFGDNVHIDKLHKELHTFRYRHYSAHRMKLAIQARLSLDILEKYVATCFTDVPNNGLPPDDFKSNVSFDNSALKKKCKLISDSFEEDRVEITWEIPLSSDFYKSKPYQYISWIIGHEGKGSLISYLRKKMWSSMWSNDKVQCDYEIFLRHNYVYSILKITVMLSYEDQRYLKEVLDAIFSFINLLKREDPQKKTICYEIYKRQEYEFRFANEKDPMDYVKDLCEGMFFYPPRDYITANKLIDIEYDPEIIQKCLNYLVPDNANITLFKKNLNTPKLKKIDMWSKTKYASIILRKKLRKHWKSIKPLPDFHLPLQNIFLTSDFFLIPIPAEVSKYPVKVHNDRVSEIWYRPDPKFCLLECYMNFQFISPLKFQSPKNAALIDMYCRVLNLLLHEELFPATVAGYDYQISVSEKGITIELNGFNEKLPLLLMTIAKYMVDYPTIVTTDLFEIVKVQQLETYNEMFIKPGIFVRDVKLMILKLVHYTHVDKHTALRGVNFEEFRDFVKSFIDCLYIQCLVQGNITQKAAIETVQQCLEIIKCAPLLTSTIQDVRVTQISLGTSYCKLKNINKVSTASVVTNYYQAGARSMELSMLIDLLMCIMNKQLSNWLSKLPFTYGSCDLQDVNGILGYSITVHIQTNKYTTKHMDQQIEEFLKSFNKILEKFSEKELNDIKKELIKAKHIVYDNLAKEVDRNWNEITKSEYIFDRFEKEVLAIKDIKINELKEWFVKYTMNGNNFRKLSVHVVGTDPKKDAIEIAKTKNSKKESFVLEYIIDDQQKTEVHYYITDIEDYKTRSLFSKCRINDISTTIVK
ncbi:Nardilysin [Trachymyrmex zeteki]|uniref:Nardilysin n=1 Tax=Mycetomoellerius zeteki TaxID=64791 RepID=A0A151X2H9_9HYME|nr:Nardilysin [Trachymyrmex zeteki]